jgi:23S rRNA (pseudouridine1915-N3)-methyltransferase
MQVIPELRNAKNLSQEQQKEQEASLIIKYLSSGDYIVLLDEHGKERRSLDFASWMQKRMAASPRRLVFIVGGPYGFAPQIHKMAQEEISLSQMTFSHQMIRLLFVEQVYRAMTILNGEPYHHE